MSTFRFCGEFDQYFSKPDDDSNIETRIINTTDDLTSFLDLPFILFNDVLIADIKQMFQLANSLNTKYSAFPLFNLKVTFDHKYRFLKASLCFQDFILAFHLAKNHPFFKRYYAFFYENKDENLLDRITFLKANQDNDDVIYHPHYEVKADNSNSSYTFKSYLLPVHTKDDYFNFDPVYTWVEDTSKHITSLDELDQNDLYPLILLVLNPLDNKTLLQTNPFYVDTYCANLLSKYNNHLLQSLKEEKSDIKDPFIFLQDTLYPINKEIHTAQTFSRDFVYYAKNDIPRHDLNIRTRDFNYLFSFNNFFYKTNYEVLDTQDVLNSYVYGSLSFNTLRKNIQILGFRYGLLHATDQIWLYASNLLQPKTYTLHRFIKEQVYDWRDPKEVSYYYATSDLMYIDGTFYKTLTLVHENTTTLITLTPKIMLTFLYQLTDHIPFNLRLAKIPSNLTGYNEEFANKNIAILNQTFINLNKNLPAIFFNQTQTMDTNLTFKQDPNSVNFHRSQAFLTFNPMIDPNYHPFVSDSNFMHKQTHPSFLHQKTNYVQLNFRNGLSELIFILSDLQYNYKDIMLVYLSFLSYLHVFFSRYVLFSKKFGYILHLFDDVNMWHGFIYFSQQDINDVMINDAYKLYDRFLVYFYKIFFSKEFINDFMSVLKDSSDFIFTTFNNFLPHYPAALNNLNVNKDYVKKEKALKEELDRLSKRSHGTLGVKLIYKLEEQINHLIQRKSLKNNAAINLINKYMTKVISKVNKGNDDLSIKPITQYVKDLIEKENVANTFSFNFDSTLFYTKNKKSRL